MVQTPLKSISLEEFLALPETKPASEYIDGEIIQKPMPKVKHSILQGELVPAINAKLKTQKVAWAFPELRCTFAGRSIVPDIAVFTWNRLSFDQTGDITDDFVSVPDWTIEILSPEQSSTTVIKKVLRCLANGCQMGWLIDPDDFSVFIYQPKHEPIYFDLEAPEEVLPVPEFAHDFQLPVGTLFSWLKG
jgi:Uma2 family endonuclease